jgi:hypothetical protein
MLAGSIIRIIEKILLGSQKYSQTYGLKLSTPGTSHQISGRLIVDDLPLLHSIFFLARTHCRKPHMITSMYWLWTATVEA